MPAEQFSAAVEIRWCLGKMSPIILVKEMPKNGDIKKR